MVFDPAASCPSSRARTPDSIVPARPPRSSPSDFQWAESNAWACREPPVTTPQHERRPAPRLADFRNLISRLLLSIEISRIRSAQTNRQRTSFDTRNPRSGELDRARARPPKEADPPSRTRSRPRGSSSAARFERSSSVVRGDALGQAQAENNLFPRGLVLTRPAASMARGRRPAVDLLDVALQSRDVGAAAGAPELVRGDPQAERRNPLPVLHVVRGLPAPAAPSWRSRSAKSPLRASVSPISSHASACASSDR